jgi:hypothetical protein
VKHLAVAEAVGLTRQRVSQALHLLVELGTFARDRKADDVSSPTCSSTPAHPLT